MGLLLLYSSLHKLIIKKRSERERRKEEEICVKNKQTSNVTYNMFDRQIVFLYKDEEEFILTFWSKYSVS